MVLALSAVLLGSSQPILRGIGLRLGFLAMAMLLVALSIVMFDRPHALVAPHLRHQPGAVAEWLGATVRPSEPPHHQPLRARSR